MRSAWKTGNASGEGHDLKTRGPLKDRVVFGNHQRQIYL